MTTTRQRNNVIAELHSTWTPRHPGSERPVYHALPSQRPCLLATHNILVQKTTALLMLTEQGSYYNELRGQAAHTVRLNNMYII